MEISELKAAIDKEMAALRQRSEHLNWLSKAVLHNTRNMQGVDTIHALQDLVENINRYEARVRLSLETLK